MCNLRDDYARQQQQQQEQLQQEQQQPRQQQFVCCQFSPKKKNNRLPVWLDNLCIDLENGPNKWPRNGAHMHIYKNDMENSAVVVELFKTTKRENLFVCSRTLTYTHTYKGKLARKLALSTKATG